MFAGAITLKSEPPPPRAARDRLGLFTSLPILWSEAPDVAALLATPARPHWVRATLEQRARIVPLDTLLTLQNLPALVVAQPRPLDPRENVALDDWVRGGGRLLLFADPMLTGPSDYAIGDPRRPQDVVLLSPILARWGLVLRFDDRQPMGLREIAGSRLRVDQAGQLAAAASGVDAHCQIEAAGVMADCTIGAGRALIVTDAAVLDATDSPDWRRAALDSLLNRAFDAATR